MSRRSNGKFAEIGSIVSSRETRRISATRCPKEHSRAHAGHHISARWLGDPSPARTNTNRVELRHQLENDGISVDEPTPVDDMSILRDSRIGVFTPTGSFYM
jgi:hypothetical protein